MMVHVAPKRSSQILTFIVKYPVDARGMVLVPNPSASYDKHDWLKPQTTKGPFKRMRHHPTLLKATCWQMLDSVGVFKRSQHPATC